MKHLKLLNNFPFSIEDTNSVWILKFLGRVLVLITDNLVTAPYFSCARAYIDTLHPLEKIFCTW